jgi:exopolysaccharide biosynthesis WecB/TagA/CpsF family protein
LIVDVGVDPPRVAVSGVGIDALTVEQAKRALRDACVERPDPPLNIATVNLDLIALANVDRGYATVLERSGLRLADGAGVIWLGRLRGNPIPERVTGSDLTEWLVDGGLPGVRLYLFGSTHDVHEQVRARAAAHGAVVVGGACPPRSAVDPPEASTALIEDIRASNADVLLVALGAPLQERWIDRWRDHLNVAAVMGVGGSLDYLGGAQRRAPESWQRLGMEWVFRLLQDPRRLWRRYLGRDIPFFVREAAQDVMARARDSMHVRKDRAVSANTRTETTIYVVRHGTTTMNVQNRYRGRREVPLDDQGWRDAYAAADALQTSNAVAVYASPLDRARCTGHVIAARIGLSGVFDHDGLVNLDYGSWEGLTAAEAAERDPDEHRRYRDAPLSAICPDGESLAEATERIEGALLDLARRHPGETVVAVSHAVMVRLLIARLRRSTGPGWRIPLGTGSTTVIRIADGRILGAIPPPSFRAVEAEEDLGHSGTEPRVIINLPAAALAGWEATTEEQAV